MITDDELADLPEKPELAFVELEKIMRARLREIEREHDRDYDPDGDRLEYINKVVAEAKVYGTEDISRCDIPRVSSRIYDAYIQFTHDVDHVTTQIRIHHAPRKRQGTVGLDQIARTKIHYYIEQIRSSINEVDLPDAKREALYRKLSDFALEVDKNRTALEAGMAVYITVCDAIGQGFEKLEPARRWIDSIAALLGSAKELEEYSRPRLPSPAERKRLDPPRKAPPSSKPPSADLDDDIPF